MKQIIYLCIIPILSGCMHLKAKREREVNRNYVFSFGEMSQSWPQGYQIEGKYDPSQGPRVEHQQIEPRIEAGKLIGRHDVWTINGDGRWIEEDKGE